MNAESPLIGLSQRLPPTDLAAEQALLGAILANNVAYERVRDFLRAEHFADPVHASVYEAITRRVEAGQLADLVTIRAELENTGRLAEVGGPAYLAELLSAMVGIVNAAEYGRLVHDAAHRRALIDAGETLIEDAFNPDQGPPAEVHQRHEAALLALHDTMAGQGRKPAAMATVTAETLRAFDGAMARRGALAGLSTGYEALDEKTGGLEAGDLILLGARPGMGKSALLCGVAMRAASRGANVFYWTGEMLREVVVQRAIAACIGRPLDVLRRGRIIDHSGIVPLDGAHPVTAEVVRAARGLAALPVTFDDTPALPVATLRGRLVRHKRRHGLDLVVIDYLGLLRASATTRQRRQRVDEVSEISEALKAIAMELRVPVLAAHQLNRGLESRDDKRPQLNDLRDSGSLEQDASTVLMLYREHYYLENAKPQRRANMDDEKYFAALNAWSDRTAATQFQAEVIVAKQRQGPTGPVPLRWQGDRTWFFDTSEPEGAPAVSFPLAPEQQHR